MQHDENLIFEKCGVVTVTDANGKNGNATIMGQKQHGMFTSARQNL